MQKVISSFKREEEHVCLYNRNFITIQQKIQYSDICTEMNTYILARYHYNHRRMGANITWGGGGAPEGICPEHFLLTRFPDN